MKSYDKDTSPRISNAIRPHKDSNILSKSKRLTKELELVPVDQKLNELTKMSKEGKRWGHFARFASNDFHMVHSDEGKSLVSVAESDYFDYEHKRVRKKFRLNEESRSKGSDPLLTKVNSMESISLTKLRSTIAK